MGFEYVICGLSAVDFWRKSSGAVLQPLLEGRPIRAPRSCDANHSQILELLRELGLDPPLHVLVGDKGERRTSKAARYHVMPQGMDASHVIPIGGGIGVCDPGLSLETAASTLSTVDLAILALELGGTYVLSPGEERGFVSTSSPLVDLEDLSGRILDSGASRYGAKKILRALDWASPFSNSPAESGVCAFFSIPREQGGLGLPGMELNHRIELFGAAREVLGTDSMRPDFYYADAATAGEYKSKQFHPEGTWTVDDRRMDALEAMGLHTFSLNNERVRSVRELSAIGRTIAERMGKRRAAPSKEVLAARRELHAKLFLASGQGHGSLRQEEAA